MTAAAPYPGARYLTAGDRGLLVEYGEGIDLDVNRRVRSMAMILEQQRPVGIVEIIPTYRSLLVVYEPSATSPEDLRTAMENAEKSIADARIALPAVVEIPVCYGGEFGPDIGFVAQTHDLSEEEVIKIHSGNGYPIYMIGFTPGFPFLGGLPEILHTPRLPTPRTRVPEGSVGIANGQTGIYPVASPGGWQLIGRTPLTLFNPQKAKPFLYKTGETIRFKPITGEQYQQIAAGGGS